MSEEMNTENIEVQAAAQPAEKLFTQDEVNAIIQKRLAQVKKHEAAAISDESLQARAKELDEREAALNARETRQTCQNYLRERGLSDDLLDVFKTDNAEEFMKSVDNAQSLLGVAAYPAVKDGGSMPDTSFEPDFKSVFLNTPAHEPKKDNPYW